MKIKDILDSDCAFLVFIFMLLAYEYFIPYCMSYILMNFESIMSVLTGLTDNKIIVGLAALFIFSFTFFLGFILMVLPFFMPRLKDNKSKEE